MHLLWWCYLWCILLIYYPFIFFNVLVLFQHHIFDVQPVVDLLCKIQYITPNNYQKTNKDYLLYRVCMYFNACHLSVLLKKHILTVIVLLKI